MSARNIEGGVSIDILVQPRASRARFGPVHGDRIKVFVTSPPVDGAANQAVVELLSKTFGVARRNVEVTSGQSSRRKTVRVLGISGDLVSEAVQ
jgi:uncharacterized protein (TIGR00251 family)